MDRRNFLRGILQGSAVAVATAAAVKLEHVPGIKSAALDELAKLDRLPEDEINELNEGIQKILEGDLGLEEGKIIVASPSQVFHPNARIWRSVTSETGAWVDYLHERTGIKKTVLHRTCSALAHACDRDLRSAEVDTDQQIVVEVPHITRTWTDRLGEPQIEIAMGVEKTEIMGHERVRVGFIGSKEKPPEIIVPDFGTQTVKNESTVAVDAPEPKTGWKELLLG